MTRGVAAWFAVAVAVMAVWCAGWGVWFAGNQMSYTLPGGAAAVLSPGVLWYTLPLLPMVALTLMSKRGAEASPWIAAGRVARLAPKGCEFYSAYWAFGYLWEAPVPGWSAPGIAGLLFGWL